jgi:hypothetical protein
VLAVVVRLFFIFHVVFFSKAASIVYFYIANGSFYFICKKLASCTALRGAAHGKAAQHELCSPLM